MKNPLFCGFIFIATMTFQVAGQSNSWVNVSNGVPANVRLVAVPGKDRVIAGDIGKSGMYATDDGGESWTKLGTGGLNMTMCIIVDPLYPDTFWECGIYAVNGSKACVTTDGGTTFRDLGTVEHNDGLSVDFKDPLRRTILIGGHESKQILHKSTDGGITFTNIGPNLPDSASLVGAPLILDSLTYIVACSGWDGTGRNGIWKTTDGGSTWRMVSTGAALQVPLVASNGYIYYPKIYHSGIMRSSNNGDTWLPAVSFGFLYSVTPVELPDGRLVSSSFKRRGLGVMNVGAVQLRDLGPATADSVTSVCYNAVRKAFFVSTMNSRGVYRLDYDSTVSGISVPQRMHHTVNSKTSTFTTTETSFLVPDDRSNKKVTATMYSTTGRVLARKETERGQKVQLPTGAAPGEVIIQVK